VVGSILRLAQTASRITFSRWALTYARGVRSTASPRAPRIRRGAAAALVALALPALVLPATAEPAIPRVGAGPVLVPVEVGGSTAPPVTEDALADALDPVLEAGDWQDVSAVVLDPADGSVVYDAGATTAEAPASTLKIATALAAITALGPDTRLRTRVVRSGSTVVVVGAGDATLSRRGETVAGAPSASLDRLAELAAEALRAAGVTSVRVTYDDSLFTGPSVSPEWSPALVYSGVIAPVSALSVDQGREDGDDSSSVAQPGSTAARYFAARLVDEGIEVTGEVVRRPAPADATEIAAVESPPIASIAEYALDASDNDVAEALAHLAGGALVGEASFAGGAKAVTRVLRAYGVPTEDLVIHDGSGLARADRAQPLTIVRALEAIVTNRSPAGLEVSAPGAWAVGSGLPVAGFTGTLSDRFDTNDTRAGLGVVRAKTGTLTGVSALAGLTRDRDGRLLVFAALTSGVEDTDSARDALDEFAATIAACGCP